MGKFEEINKRHAMIAELKLYLESTDHHILKQAEGGYICPQDILFQRAESRENINALQSEVEQLDQVPDEELLLNENSTIN